MQRATLLDINRALARVFPDMGQIAYALLTRSPLGIAASLFFVNLTSKKFSWAVTKHISDSFNLPESLAGFRLSFRSFWVTRSRVRPIIEFSGIKTRGQRKKNQLFFHFFEKSSNHP